MQPFLENSLKTWEISQPTQNSKGNKIAAIVSRRVPTFQPQPITLQLTENENPLRCPFGACSWADVAADRLNLDFSAPPDLAQYFEAADETICELATKNSESLFGKIMSYGEVLAQYTPMVKEGKLEYPSTIRTKINMTGRRALKCYTPEGTPRDFPEDFRAVRVVPGVLVSHLWFQNKSFGVVLETTHAKIHETSEECPF